MLLNQKCCEIIVSIFFLQIRGQMHMKNENISCSCSSQQCLNTMREYIEKKSNFKCMFGCGCTCNAQLPQKLKSTFFFKKNSLQVPFGDPRLEKISENVDFSLCGKQCIVLPKWTFSRVLAHCKKFRRFGISLYRYKYL